MGAKRTTSLFVSEVVELIKQGTSVRKAKEQVAEKHGLNYQSLRSLCSQNAEYRNLRGTEELTPYFTKSLSGSVPAEKPAVRSAAMTSDPDKFMAQFFRYLGDLQAEADATKVSQREVERLRRELETARVEIARLKAEVNRLATGRERAAAVQQDHFKAVMARARQQFIDGQPD